MMMMMMKIPGRPRIIIVVDLSHLAEQDLLLFVVELRK